MISYQFNTVTLSWNPGPRPSESANTFLQCPKCHLKLGKLECSHQTLCGQSPGHLSW